MSFFNWFKKTEVQKTRGADLMVSDFRANSSVYPAAGYYDLVHGAFKKNSIVYAGSMEISSSLSEARLAVYDNDDLSMDTYPLLNLIARPNKYTTEFFLFEQTVMHMVLSGNAFWLKVRNGRKKITELWALRPDYIKIIPDKKNFIKLYMYEIDGEKYPIMPDDIIQFKMPNPESQLIGMSPLIPAIRQIATDNEATDFAKVLLQNGGVPSGVLSVPDTIPQELRDRLRQQWKHQYGGSNRGSLAILEGDVAYKPISMNMQSLAFTDLRDISESRILSVLGVPPILIGAKSGLAHSTYSNYEEARRSFWEETISSWQRRISSVIEIDKDLNPMGYKVGFDNNTVAALQESRQLKFNNTITAYQSGLITQEEARAEMGLCPLDIMEEEELQEEPEPEIEEESTQSEEKSMQSVTTKQLPFAMNTLKVADVYYDRFLKWAKKELKKQGVQLTTLITQSKKAMEPSERDEIIGGLYKLEGIWEASIAESSSGLMEGLLINAADDVALVLGAQIRTQEAITNEYISNYKLTMAKSISKTSADRATTAIKAAFEESKPMSELKKDLTYIFNGDGGKARAETIARTETVRAANEGSRQAYKAAGVVEMQWLAVSDSCPYCQELNGKVVSVDTPFLEQGEHFQPEGATSPLNTTKGMMMAPPAHPNCRCTIVPRGI